MGHFSVEVEKLSLFCPLVVSVFDNSIPKCLCSLVKSSYILLLHPAYSVCIVFCTAQYCSNSSFMSQNYVGISSRFLSSVDQPQWSSATFS